MTDNLPKHVKYWFSEARHDCFFLVGPEFGPTERIGAMKTLLMGYSEPFRAMLQDSELAEPSDVRLIDVEAETFRNFLKCVYGASAIIIRKLSFEETVKLLYVIEKYMVDDLKARTLAHLKKKWSCDKLFLALSHPLCFNEEILQESIIDTLKKGFLEISTDKEFLNVSVAGMVWILQQEELNVKEVSIWNAVLQWAQHQTNSNDGEVLRSHMFPLLKYIRFLAMDYKDFFQKVVLTGILLKEEINEILQSRDSENIPSIVHLCKSKRHRCTTFKESENIVSTSLETPNGITVVCTINNIISLSSSWCSEPVSLAGFFWRLMISKAITLGDHQSLSIFLECINCVRGWPQPVEHTCNANCTFTLMNQSGQLDVNRTATHKFCLKENDWGFRHFYEWDSVINPDKGFIKDDKIIVSARIHLID